MQAIKRALNRDRRGYTRAAKLDLGERRVIWSGSPQKFTERRPRVDPADLAPEL